MNKKVKLYGLPTCPICRRIKKYLEDEGIDYEYLDVSANHDIAKEMIVKSGQKIKRAGCNLLVCGTASAVTRQQIDKLLERHSYEFIQLPPGMLADQKRGDDFSKTVSLARSSKKKLSNTY